VIGKDVGGGGMTGRPGAEEFMRRTTIGLVGDDPLPRMMGQWFQAVSQNTS